MTELIVVPQTDQWQRLKALVLDSVSLPDKPWPGFTKATVRGDAPEGRDLLWTRIDGRLPPHSGDKITRGGRQFLGGRGHPWGTPPRSSGSTTGSGPRAARTTSTGS
jgi:hypothetical protein